MTFVNRVLYLQILDESVRHLYEDAVEKREAAFLGGEKHIDSGFDIFTPIPSSKVPAMPGATLKLRLGIRCAVFINDDLEDSPSQPYYIYPRSSMSKTPLRLANSVGIIDSGYRGELIAMLDNIDMEETYRIQHGQRLLQICMPDLQPFKVKLVVQLDDTTRGSGGFGSTGS